MSMVLLDSKQVEQFQRDCYLTHQSAGDSPQVFARSVR